MNQRTTVRVTYVISTRNRVDCLRRTLANVREFITSDDELIVADGASTDGTDRLIADNADLVARFISEPDCGEAHGFNKGLLAARGEYIKVLTDDDYFYPDGIRRMIAVLETHPEVDALICGGELCLEDPGAGEPRVADYARLPANTKLRGNARAMYGYGRCGLGLVFRRRLLSRVGLFDTTFRAIDTEYMTRLVACGVDVRYLDVKLYRHTTWAHSGGNLQREMVRDWLRVVLRDRDWDRMMDRETFSRETVAEVLGLAGQPGADQLLEILDRANHLRWTRRPAVLAMLLRMVRAYSACLEGYSHLRRLATRSNRRTTAATAAPEGPLSEPDWTGELR